eukprot:scaffold101190_cov16-Tisochrysis_lutea.AAC.3
MKRCGKGKPRACVHVPTRHDPCALTSGVQEAACHASGGLQAAVEKGARMAKSCGRSAALTFCKWWGERPCRCGIQKGE